MSCSEISRIIDPEQERDAIRAALRRARRVAKPPPKLTVSQWADRYRKLSRESSGEPGQWKTDRAPYQRKVMDLITDPSVRELWVKKSAQIGWTEILNNVIGYHVHQDPAPILLVQPTVEMAEAWSKDRLAPMIRDTPVLRDLIADPKSRDSGNTVLHKKFTGGHLTIAGANSPAGLASRPIRIVLFDEVDRFPASAGAEGDPISLGRKRSTAFWNRKMLAGSTPTVKGQSRIDAGFDASNQMHLHVPCPHCDSPQRLYWAQVRWEENKPSSARYVCKHCGVLWTNEERIAAVAEGCKRDLWIAEKPFDGIAGLHIFELHSPFVSMEEMVRSFLDAKKLPETLKTWVNTSLGETWEEQGSTVEPEGLLTRREQYGPQNIPEAALLLTAGVDVQDDRIEVQVNAWGLNEENWIVQQEVFRGDPGKMTLWSEVDSYLLQQFMTEDGRALYLDAVAIDSGGHNTQTVYNFVISRKRRRVWAIKGMAGTGKLAWPKKASRTAKSRALVYIVGVDTIKSTLYGRLQKVTEPGSGYIHLPHEADEDFVTQLTSEKSVTKYVRGRPTVVWQPRAKNIRQEAQDCWVYAYAAFVGRRGPELLKKLSRRASRVVQRVAAPSDETANDAVTEPARIEQPSQQVTQTQAKPKRVAPPRRKGFVKGWRW
jgi:phage terminase large subunit GpA-like protein